MNIEDYIIENKSEQIRENAQFSNASGKLPLSISIETECGLVTRIAEIGDVLPIKRTIVFSTNIDMPEAVGIRFYAGERPFAKDNLLIGEFTMEHLQKLPYGRPAVTVSVEVETFGAINIEVVDEGSLQCVEYQIPANWIPPYEEIVELVKTAQDNLESDTNMQNKYRMLQHARESLCRSEAEFTYIRKKLSVSDQMSYRGKIKRLKSRLKKVNPEDMTELTEKAIIDAVNALNNAPKAE